MKVYMWDEINCVVNEYIVDDTVRITGDDNATGQAIDQTIAKIVHADPLTGTTVADVGMGVIRYSGAFGDRDKYCAVYFCAQDDSMMERKAKEIAEEECATHLVWPDK